MKLILPLATLLLLGGCAVGFAADDGSGMVGVRVGRPTPGSLADARATGSAFGATIGGLAGGPAGAAAGASIGDIVGYGIGLLGIGGTAIAARRATKHASDAAELRGREQGWDEHAASRTIQVPVDRPYVIGTPAGPTYTSQGMPQ